MIGLLLNIPSVRPDELLPSWVHRMADMNAASYSGFISAYFGVNFRTDPHIPIDLRQGFPHFAMILGLEEFMDKAYLSLSTFSYESIAMTAGQQTRYVHNVFRPMDKLNPPANMAFSTLRLCPECMKEDTEKYGGPYFHRAHQLSGVCACHKHGVPLLVFTGKRGRAFDLDEYVEEPLDVKPESAAAYARYAKALLDSHISTDASGVKRVIFERMAALGYGISDGYDSFLSDFEEWEHSDLWGGGDMYRFFRHKLSDPRYLSMTEVVPLFMFLFPEASELTALLTGHGPLLERRTCPDCGRVYVTTPYAKETGWGCPYCDGSVPEEERFKHLVSITTDDEYEPLEEFTSLGIKMPFFHAACGKQIKIRPRELLFDGRRCPCEKTIPESEVRKAVEAHPGFKLVSYSGTAKPAVFYHEGCGQEFSCRLERFTAAPFCRICDPVRVDTDVFADHVKALVGDEYTVVGEYKGSTADIAIRHNTCGRTRTYRASRFLDGQRCKYCSGHFSRKDIEDMLAGYSGGRYTLRSYEKEKCFLFDNKTGRAICLPPLKLVQEMTRVTPSEILPSDDGKSIKRVGAWEKNYDLLVKRKEETGTARMAKKTTYRDVRLGEWCSNQRQAHRRGSLSPERTRLLLKVDPHFFDRQPRERG